MFWKNSGARGNRFWCFFWGWNGSTNDDTETRFDIFVGFVWVRLFFNCFNVPSPLDTRISNLTSVSGSKWVKLPEIGPLTLISMAGTIIFQCFCFFLLVGNYYQTWLPQTWHLQPLVSKVKHSTLLTTIEVAGGQEVVYADGSASGGRLQKWRGGAETPRYTSQHTSCTIKPRSGITVKDDFINFG